MTEADDPPASGKAPAPGSAIRVRISVRGRVQGVWFRGSTREQAERLDLAGWARNLADGSVEVVAQGDADAIQQLADWCRHGPTGARVTSVTIDREPVQDDLQGFHVR